VPLVAAPDNSLYDDLARQDDVGLVLRGHLHIERELVNLASAMLPFHARCDWGKLSFRAKVELAYACGLPLDVKNLLEKVGSLRNDFAHKLSARISKSAALDLYNSLSPRHRSGLKGSYKVMFGKVLSKPAALPPHDLLTLVLLTAHSATRAAALALRGNGT
jgi:hypothetical protein